VLYAIYMSLFADESGGRATSDLLLFVIYWVHLLPYFGSASNWILYGLLNTQLQMRHGHDHHSGCKRAHGGLIGRTGGGMLARGGDVHGSSALLQGTTTLTGNGDYYGVGSAGGNGTAAAARGLNGTLHLGRHTVVGGKKPITASMGGCVGGGTGHHHLSVLSAPHSGIKSDRSQSLSDPLPIAITHLSGSEAPTGLRMTNGTLSTGVDYSTTSCSETQPLTSGGGLLYNHLQQQMELERVECSSSFYDEPSSCVIEEAEGDQRL